MIVGFSKAKAWYKVMSDLIAFSEKRKYSHAYFKYTCPISGIEMVSQASKGFVNEITYVNFLRENVVIEEITLDLNLDETLNILKWCKSLQGNTYGMDQILSITIKKILGKSLKVNNGDKKLICSEYIIRGIQQAKIYFGRDVINLDEVTPSDLNKIIKNYVQHGY